MDIREEWVRTSQPFVLPMPHPQTLFSCFSRRANVVVGDIFVQGAQDIVDAINRLPPGNGKACWKRCDVTNWEDQVALFELAMTRFGGVDIVVSAPCICARRLVVLILDPRVLGANDRSPVLGLEKSRASGHYRSRKQIGNSSGHISRRLVSTWSGRYIVSPR